MNIHIYIYTYVYTHTDIHTKGAHILTGSEKRSELPERD